MPTQTKKQKAEKQRIGKLLYVASALFLLIFLYVNVWVKLSDFTGFEPSTQDAINSASQRSMQPIANTSLILALFCFAFGKSFRTQK